MCTVGLRRALRGLADSLQLLAVGTGRQDQEGVEGAPTTSRGSPVFGVLGAAGPPAPGPCVCGCAVKVRVCPAGASPRWGLGPSSLAQRMSECSVPSQDPGSENEAERGSTPSSQPPRPFLPARWLWQFLLLPL